MKWSPAGIGFPYASVTSPEATNDESTPSAMRVSGDAESGTSPVGGPGDVTEYADAVPRDDPAPSPSMTRRRPTPAPA